MTTTRSAQELIEDGQALVHSLAARIHHSIPVRVDLDDLIAYGEVGLAEAARRFHADEGIQFTTFAYYRVRGAIYDGLSKMSWTSRARHRRFRFQQLANETLARDGEEHPPCTDDTLADEAHWFRGVTEKLAMVYLVSQECDDCGGDSVFQDPHDSAATLVARKEIGERLHELVDRLPKLEAQLIDTVYFQGANLQQAADHLAMSKSWASRLHTRALERLARQLRQLNAQDTPQVR